MYNIKEFSVSSKPKMRHSYNGLVYQPSKLGVRVRFPYAARTGSSTNVMSTPVWMLCGGDIISSG